MHGCAQHFSPTDLPGNEEKRSSGGGKWKSAADIIQAIPPLLRAIQSVRSEEAWSCLAVGCIEEARRLSERANDVVAWAASFALGGDVQQTLLIVESYIIATCTVLYEYRQRVRYASSRDPQQERSFVLRRHTEIVILWMNRQRCYERSDPSINSLHAVKEVECREVLLQAMELLDWAELHRWYCVALSLYLARSETDVEVGNKASSAGVGGDCGVKGCGYVVPANYWFRSFFALIEAEAELPGGDGCDMDPSTSYTPVLSAVQVEKSFYQKKQAAGQTRRMWFSMRGGREDSCTAPPSRLPSPSSSSSSVFLGSSSSLVNEVPPMKPFGQQWALSVLLSHCCEADIFFVSAVAGFRSRHYRTSMFCASRALALMESKSSCITPCKARAHPYQLTLMRFVRAVAALHIGERVQANEDILSLMSMRKGAEETVESMVGCSLALYGMPLPEAEAVVLSKTPSPVVQRYLYCLAEFVHALTLLQLGMVEEARDLGKTVIETLGDSHKERVSGPCNVEDGLRDIIIYCAAALEDSSTVLETSLSAHRLAYLALCASFFGGLAASGISVKENSETYNLLYPSHLAPYTSIRQMIPFHMNRATFFFHDKKFTAAWDDVCCAVAAADEVVGSVEFAFTHCFPLMVYSFACQVGVTLLETLLHEDLEAAKACLPEPDNETLLLKKDETLQAHEELGLEVVKLTQSISRRMKEFYPNSRLAELCQLQIAILCREKQYLSRSVVLSRRYPYSVAAQNMLTVALYFEHHIPEALDNATKNLEEFPHSQDVIRAHQMLQRKNLLYTFNYRTLVPLKYKAGSVDRIFTKRMIIVIVLLVANLVVLFLTVLVNIPGFIDLPEGIRELAIRLQLPSLVPLLFAPVLVIHSIVAATTSRNLIHTTLKDLHFVDTVLNRVLFCLRCVPLINVVNALQVSIAGNNFLIEHQIYTFVLYLFLTILFVPFTTRIFFLPSTDEPDMEFISWLSLFFLDAATSFLILIPHILLGILEPYMSIIFYFCLPVERQGVEAKTSTSSSIRRRVLFHKHSRKHLPRRFTQGSGSRFFHIRLLRLLYFHTHSSMETKYLAESQMEAELYRVFPLLEGPVADLLFATASPKPLKGQVLTARRTSRTSGRDSKTPVREEPVVAVSPPTLSLQGQSAFPSPCNDALFGDSSGVPLGHIRPGRLAASGAGAAAGTSATTPGMAATAGGANGDHRGGGNGSSPALLEEAGAQIYNRGSGEVTGLRLMDIVREHAEKTERQRTFARHVSFVRPSTAARLNRGSADMELNDWYNMDFLSPVEWDCNDDPVENPLAKNSTESLPHSSSVQRKEREEENRVDSSMENLSSSSLDSEEEYYGGGVIRVDRRLHGGSTKTETEYNAPYTAAPQVHYGGSDDGGRKEFASFSAVVADGGHARTMSGASEPSDMLYGMYSPNDMYSSPSPPRNLAAADGGAALSGEPNSSTMGLPAWAKPVGLLHTALASLSLRRSSDPETVIPPSLWKDAEAALYSARGMHGGWGNMWSQEVLLNMEEILRFAAKEILLQQQKRGFGKWSNSTISRDSRSSATSRGPVAVEAASFRLFFSAVMETVPDRNSLWWHGTSPAEVREGLVELFVSLIQAHEASAVTAVCSDYYGIPTSFSLQEWQLVLEGGFGYADCKVATEMSSGSLGGIFDCFTVVFRAAELWTRAAASPNSTGEQLAPFLQQSLESVLDIRSGAIQTSRVRTFLSTITEAVSPYCSIDPGAEKESSIDGQTIFTRACHLGCLAVVAVLVEDGYARNLNAVLSSGSNGLIEAVRQKKWNIVQYLCTYATDRLEDSFEQKFNGADVVQLAQQCVPRENAIVDLLIRTRNDMRYAMLYY